MQYTPLQHWTLLSPPDTSMAECCSCFSPATSLLLEVLVMSYALPQQQLDTPRPGRLTFQHHIFLSFHTVPVVLQTRILEWVAISFSIFNYQPYSISVKFFWPRWNRILVQFSKVGKYLFSTNYTNVYLLKQSAVILQSAQKYSHHAYQFSLTAKIHYQPTSKIILKGTSYNLL